MRLPKINIKTFEIVKNEKFDFCFVFFFLNPWLSSKRFKMTNMLSIN